MDPVTKQSKGYGFVKFKDYEQSQKALNEMNGKMLVKKTMKTKLNFTLFLVKQHGKKIILKNLTVIVIIQKIVI